MSNQPEALELAERLATRVPSKTCVLDLTSAAELRRQHSRIEADEALMRQALDALTETYNTSTFPVGSLLLRGESITALRARLENTNAS